MEPLESLRGRLEALDKDQFYPELLDCPEGKTVSRRIGFKGEVPSEQSR